MAVWLYATDGFTGFYLQKGSQTLKTDLKRKVSFLSCSVGISLD